MGHSKTTSFMLSGHRQEEDLSQSFLPKAFGPHPGERAESQAGYAGDVSSRPPIQRQPQRFLAIQRMGLPQLEPGRGRVRAAGSGDEHQSMGTEWTFNDRISVSPRLLFQFQILAGWEHHIVTSVSEAPKIVVQDAFTAGGAQADVVNTERHVQLNGIGSWTAGKQFLKFGVNVRT